MENRPTEPASGYREEPAGFTVEGTLGDSLDRVISPAEGAAVNPFGRISPL